MSFELHPQLAADCHLLGVMPSGVVLLHRNAAVPWLILVPQTDVIDLLDLPTDQLAAVMTDARQLSAFIRDFFHSAKINFAAIGNVVPQMHLHIIGRHSEDCCWPKPVWGNLQEHAEYSSEVLQVITEQLSVRLMQFSRQDQD
ncbi:MAG: HIT family protein [Planctomycetaceae bacterium]|nr:HIT family protein [Planctomycetaceae bacterium]